MGQTEAINRLRFLTAKEAERQRKMRLQSNGVREREFSHEQAADYPDVSAPINLEAIEYYSEQERHDIALINYVSIENDQLEARVTAERSGGQ